VLKVLPGEGEHDAGDHAQDRDDHLQMSQDDLELVVGHEPLSAFTLVSPAMEFFELPFTG
jgi:hypothetical protein